MEKIPGGPRCEWVQKQVCQDAPITPSSCQNPPNSNCVPCDMDRQQNGAFDPNNGIYVPGNNSKSKYTLLICKLREKQNVFYEIGKIFLF